MTKKLFISLFVSCVLILLSIGIVLLSAFGVPTKVQSYEDMKNAQFGFPISFIKQDLIKSGITGYEGGFPDRFEMQTDFLDNDITMDFSMMNFIFSTVIVFGMVLLLYILLRKFGSKLWYG
ncbi:hypothetical protein [Paenibacillus andongensis]|uniref:hypothetical protein n=1 Tax=Paenibacillus andongensis TaxID=2975482 RepID=UPI0021BA4B3F|nr:hypothetical protein [Paenibacillus andongensis]